MTRKVFWEDPYLSSLETTVAAVAGTEVRLAETIFFAFSGGQERDHGTIGGYEVGCRTIGPVRRSLLFVRCHRR